MPHLDGCPLYGLLLCDSLLSTLHALAWSIYVGGAICMELILRHAQQFMKPSQTAYVCEFSGHRYRWWSFYCLIVLLISGALLAVRAEDASPFYLGLVAALAGLWVVQVALLAMLSFRVHPQMHARLLPSMSRDEMHRERLRVKAAIERMDQVLRIELVTAICAVFTGSVFHMSFI